MQVDVLSSLAEQTKDHLVARMRRQRPWDTWLLLTTLVLIGFGLIMLYSASAVMAAQKMSSHLHLVKSQLTKFTLGMIMLVGALKLDYRWYKRLVYPIFGGTLLMLILVAIPGVGTVQNGARRWFSVMGMSFQPAEVAKIAAIMFLAYSVSKKESKMGSFTLGFMPNLLMIGVMVFFLMLQPDFGSSVILLSCMMMMLFVSGARLSYLLMMAGVGAVGAFIAITGSAYRMKRIMAFMDPWSHRSNIGYQISESLIAIGSGGVTGKGLGNGNGKLGYVPELWNDFIGTIVAEELGLMGIILLVSLFVVFLWRGLNIAIKCEDRFGMYLAFGLTSMFTLQAVANLFVVTGLAPTKGLTLPFVSFGGSSLIMAMFATGILLNISQNAPDMWEARKNNRSVDDSGVIGQKRKGRRASRRFAE